MSAQTATIEDAEGGTRLAAWTVQQLLRLGPEWFFSLGVGYYRGPS